MGVISCELLMMIICNMNVKIELLPPRSRPMSQTVMVSFMCDFSHHHSCRCPAGTVMTTELDMEQCLLSSFCAIQCAKCDFSRLEDVIKITDKISRNLVELREICISYMSLFANLFPDDIQYLSHSSQPHRTWWDYDWISLKQEQRSCSHSQINMKTTVSI